MIKCNELIGVKYLNEYAVMMKKGNVEVIKGKIIFYLVMLLYINFLVEVRYCRFFILY